MKVWPPSPATFSSWSTVRRPVSMSIRCSRAPLASARIVPTASVRPSGERSMNAALLPSPTCNAHSGSPRRAAPPNTKPADSCLRSAASRAVPAASASFHFLRVCLSFAGSLPVQVVTVAPL